MVLTEGVVIDGPLNVGTTADPTSDRPARQGAYKGPHAMKTKTDVLLGIALTIVSTVALAGAPIRTRSRCCRSSKNCIRPRMVRRVTVRRSPACTKSVMGQNIAYVGGDGRHFLFGHLFDMRTQQDLTAAKHASETDVSAETRQVNFASLPLSDAIKTVKGDGSRVLAVFSDPNCPYCKVLDEELAKLDNVTVYTFLLPWLSPESRPAAAALWAAAVPERANDTAVLDRNLKLASELGLRGTPMLIARDGRVSEGARSAEALDAWLTLAIARSSLSPDRQQGAAMNRMPTLSGFIAVVIACAVVSGCASMAGVGGSVRIQLQSARRRQVRLGLGHLLQLRAEQPAEPAPRRPCRAPQRGGPDANGTCSPTGKDLHRPPT